MSDSDGNLKGKHVATVTVEGARGWQNDVDATGKHIITVAGARGWQKDMESKLVGISPLGIEPRTL